MLNVAIIGANGFIGSHLSNELSKFENINLFLFGRSVNSVLSDRFNYNQIDLLNRNQIELLFKDIDVVYYLASYTIPSSSWENPSLEIEQNLIPFISFTETIVKLKVKKIIFLSSAGTIYGSSKSKLDETSFSNPFSPYGIVKLTIEHFLNYFQTKYNLNYDIYRVSNVYGEGQNTGKGLGVINTFLENIIDKQEIQIFGDGNTIRNYIHVKDVVSILNYSLKSDTSASNVYNLSSNDTLSLNDLISIITKVVPEKFTVSYKKTRLSDNPVIDIDHTKILKLIPDYKFISLMDGINQTYKYIKNINR